MTNNIIIPNINTFNFNHLRLLPAMNVQGNAYFTKFEYNNKPLYIQSCKSFTKQGLVKSGKRYYCDLMFDATNEDIITWFEELENKCYDLMYEKKDRWFQGSISKEDIENTFTPTLRVYKSGKYYLVRANLKTNSSNTLEFKLYDEEQNDLAKDLLTNKSKIISILEISGIKFTQQKFQIEIILKQSMIINDEIIFEECLIKQNTNNQQNSRIYNANNYENNESIEDDKKFDNLEELNNNNENDDNENNENNDNENNDNENNDNENNDIRDDDNDFNKELHNRNVDNNDDDIIEENNYSIEKSDKIVIEDKKNNKNLKEKDDIDIDNDDDSLTEIDPFIDIEEMSVIENKPMKIKQPNEVYYNMYKKARIEAKEAKKKAQYAYLEAKKIKDLHLLDVSDSDSDSDIDINENSNY